MNGQSRRLHALETWWSDSCPNGVAERPWDLLRVPTPAASARRGPRRQGPGADPRRPVLGGGVGARPGLPFLSAGAHGRSRRFSVLVTSWGVSCPNGVARDRRGTSCAPRDTPPLPGGHRGGLARGALSVSFPGGPAARTAVSLTWGGRSFPGALCAAHPPAPALRRAGWPGPAAELPWGRAAGAERSPRGAAAPCPGDGIY